jgi:hypothetical protein
VAQNQVKIALVTARQRPEVNVDYDMPLLRKAVAEAGAEVAVTAWDDPAVEWADFDLAVIRSTWDYSWRLEQFLDWVDRCSSLTRLANAPEVVHWNARKEYLCILAEKAISVVRTRYINPGDPIELPDDIEYVVKPAVGGGARFAARYRPEDHDVATMHVRRMHAEKLTAMIQPYLHQIDTSGERALVFLQGKFLHAVRKRAVLVPELRYDERRDGHPGLEQWSPTPDELELAKRALAGAPQSDELLYARVDVVGDAGDEPIVTELELVEPRLYLTVHPESIPKVACTIVQTAIDARRTLEARSVAKNF